jgi:protein-tyrosine phosphatase
MGREVVRHFENLSNFRDVGGLPATEGRTFKTGALYRSDELSAMTAADLLKLQELNIRLICDLRSPEECQKRRPRISLGRGIRVVNIPLHDQSTQDGSRKKLLRFLFAKTGGEQFREFCRRYYHHIAFEQTSRIRDVITLLASEQSLPALIHCTAGKDRTGFLAAVIQLLVGVPWDLVRDDYLRTNDYLEPRLKAFIKAMRFLTLFQVSPERMQLVLKAHPEFLAEVHDNIVTRYGSVENYLCDACAIEPDALERLKRRLLA